MVAWDSGATLAMRFRAHAGDAQHLYGFAMRAMADVGVQEVHVMPGERSVEFVRGLGDDVVPVLKEL